MDVLRIVCLSMITGHLALKRAEQDLRPGLLKLKAIEGLMGQSVPCPKNGYVAVSPALLIAKLECGRTGESAHKRADQGRCHEHVQHKPIPSSVALNARPKPKCSDATLILVVYRALFQSGQSGAIAASKFVVTAFLFGFDQP